VFRNVLDEVFDRDRAHLPDFAVALAEDVIAIAGGLLIVSHL